MLEHVQRQIQGFLKTPPLWTKTQFGIPQFQFPEVDLSSLQPKPISQKLRLGHQMEQVCKQLLDHSPNFEVLLYNEPVREGKQTLGEMDYILRDTATGALVHVELTYKFYLIDPAISEPIHQLMGPNRRDMFFTKMEKIKQQQFTLLHTAPAQRLLAEKGLQAPIAHQALFKAQLFAPYQSKPIPIRPLNPECIVGQWLRMADLQTDAFKGASYYIPYKTEWVVEPHDQVPWMPYFEALLEINLRLLQQNAPMVWVKKKDATLEKCFVVWW